MNQVRKRILHVDADPEIRKFIAVILSDIADVTPAISLHRARELIQETRYDLLIVDFTLPDGSGSELIAEMARLDPSIPVIALCSHELSANMVNVKQVYDKTQLDKQQLTETVRSLLK